MQAKDQFGQCFYGSATVGERGQIVIPAEARGDLGIQPGDKVLVMKHPIYDGLMIAKFESLRGFLDELQSTMQALEVSPVGGAE